jgi:hypothetical protein
MTESCAQTFSGRRLVLGRVAPADIDLTDIAVQLSRICRFNGATRRWYCVAEHSLRVAERLGPDAPPMRRLQALLHDAPEAILGDLIAPLKRLDAVYRGLEHQAWTAVAGRFDLPVDLHPAVAAADARMFATEVRDLMAKPWPVEADPYPEHLPFHEERRDLWGARVEQAASELLLGRPWPEGLVCWLPQEGRAAREASTTAPPAAAASSPTPSTRRST